jgi:hypothetical protein
VLSLPVLAKWSIKDFSIPLWTIHPLPVVALIPCLGAELFGHYVTQHKQRSVTALIWREGRKLSQLRMHGAR